ncbi:PilN domain-containing protein [Marilutibacter chinensis]|uniref:PilN domain-containing protein n=1 Tax=Marilutibacter chinensis TaxID=2912247 RepID=A0ABS9HVI3_9GAMM|nr:PilN domain-containing protein [Lysobacter chinensis]MCF7222097.1 PilN domain-containing protein [Lysobacter chinensis]
MTALRDRLGAIGRGSKSGMGARLWPGAGRFLAWWGRSLASWLPSTLRRALGVGRGRLMLQAAGDEILLSRHQDEALQPLGQIPAPPADGDAIAFAASATSADPLDGLLAPRLAELPRWLLLPASTCLRRRLRLPAAAADRLRDVVGFEVDRQTPFAAEAVVYDARVLGHHDGDGQLDVELVVVPRAALAPQRDALGALAADLAGVDVAGPDGVPIGVNLLPPSERRLQRDPWRLWNWGLAALAVTACGLMLWQVLENRRAAADVFEQQIGAQAAAGRQAAAQRQRLVSLIKGQAFLDTQRAARPTAVEVIDELTRRLPDSTYLEKLSLEDRRMMLIGLSSEAPALIGRLQGAGQWRSPALAGALQPDPASGRDRFTLTAELTAAPSRPAGAEAAPAQAPAAASDAADPDDGEGDDDAE